jgi:hypothetical protein
MRKQDRWLLWRYEWRDKAWDKVPYRARRPQQRASSTDPATWATFAEAHAAYKAGAWDGVGFVLGDGRAGIDLDDCRDSRTGTITAAARAIIARLRSYSEVSPSGTGIKTFVLGTLPPQGRKGEVELDGRKCKVEMYDAQRFFTVTGRHVRGTPTTVAKRTRDLAALHRRVVGAKAEERRTRSASITPVLDAADLALLQQARDAANGAKFTALWSGDTTGYKSRSEADLALCNFLAYWLDGDPGRIDRFFRHSQLMRPKWDHRRGAQTYGARTIGLALDGWRRTAAAAQAITVPPPPPAPAPELQVPAAGVLGVGREFAELHARYLETPLSFFYFAFLTYFGALVTKLVTLASELRPEPRLYTVLLGESATTRKSTALRKADDFFQSLGADHAPSVLMGVGSAEGLAAHLKEHPQHGAVLHLDELKSFIDKARNEASVLLPAVSTLFERDEYENRTKTTHVSIRGASLALLAASTIDTYASIFDPRFFSLGFLNRLWLVADRSTTSVPIPASIPEASLRPLRQRVTTIHTRLRTEFRRNHHRPVGLPISPAADCMFRDWYGARQGSIFESRLDTYGHRLMVLLAASSEKAEVDVPVMTAVLALLDYQLSARRLCDPVNAENRIAAMEEKIRRQLSRGTLSDRELKRRVHSERDGLWVFSTATKNLLAAHELQRDPTTTAWSLIPTPVPTAVPTPPETEQPQ